MDRVRLLALVLFCLLSSCRRDGPAPQIERLQPSLPEGEAVALPAEWSGAYAAALSQGAGAAPITLEVPDPRAAADAVRQGRARAALTIASEVTGVTAREVETIPVALIVPLTFPVEGISADQAREVASGRVRDWRLLGGPSRAVAPVADSSPAVLSTLRRVLGDESFATTHAAAGADVLAAGAVEFQLGNRPGLNRKVLAVDGHLPGEPGYPLVERRVVAGRDTDPKRLDALADALRRTLETRRPADIVLDAVGDVMLGRDVGRLIAERGTAFPFELVRPILAASDLRFGNLELPLTDRGTPARKDYVFRAPASSVAALISGGVNVVSLANNHALDYGPDGLLDTIAVLDRAGIAHTGAGRTPEEARAPAIVMVRGLRIALLAYANVPNDSVTGFIAESMTAAPGRPGVAWGRVADVQQDVKAARQRADLVIVSLHSGFEYTAQPNTIQRELARAAVDAGAALVLGHHPHVLQGVEFYRGAPIIYSLGNFVFDLDDSDRRQPGLPSVLTVILRVTLGAAGVEGVRFIPAIIDTREGRPVPVAGAEAKPVLDRLYRLTDALNP